MSKCQILVHIEKPVNYTLFEVKWVPFSSRLVALGSHPKGTGVMQIYDMTKGELKLLKEVDRPKALKCGTFSASLLPQRQLATGDFDGAFTVWDLERLDIPVFSANAHSSIINAIDGCGGLKVGLGAPEIVTCGRDGLVKVWDIRQKAPVAIIEAEEGQTKRDCWTVSIGNACSESERMISAGYENGDLKLFDLKSMKVHWETNVGNGICSTEFDRKDIEMNKLSVCTLDSKIFVFDMRNKHPTKGFAFVRQKAHKSTVWAGKHSPHDRDIMMTSGGNGSLCLWQYEYPAHRTTKDSEGNVEGVPGKLNLIHEIGASSQPITAFDWNPQFSGLAACSSFDQTLRVVGVPRLKCI